MSNTVIWVTIGVWFIEAMALAWIFIWNAQRPTHTRWISLLRKYPPVNWRVRVKWLGGQIHIATWTGKVWRIETYTEGGSIPPVQRFLVGEGPRLWAPLQ